MGSMGATVGSSVIHGANASQAMSARHYDNDQYQTQSQYPEQPQIIPSQMPQIANQ